MLDRFKDAKWYIGGGDELNTIIYDASDVAGPFQVREWNGPDGHGMVCQDAVIEDARLIAASPDLLAAAKALLQRGPVGIESECHWCGREGEDTEHCSNDDCMGTLARAAIAKAEGPSGGYARLLDTDPNFESFVRGYIDKAEGRA
jgi:hypothetical protein